MNLILRKERGVIMESGIGMFVIIGVVTGFFSNKLANEKGYNPALWFLGGLFFNVIALIAIAGLPKKDLAELKLKREQNRIEKVIRETGKNS